MTRQPLVIDPPSPADIRSQRRKRRLWFLLVLAGLTVGFYVFVKLDRSVAERLGQVAEGVHDLFNQVPGKAAPLTPAGRRLVEDVKALGGHAGVHVNKPGFFGTIGQQEWNTVSAGGAFDDDALARLAESHGDRIGGLYLDNTQVTDDGLKSLSKFTMLRHLRIRNFPIRRNRGTGGRGAPGAGTATIEPIPPSNITDEGLVHLKGLNHLWSLDLSDLAITDAGLDAIKDLPELNSLYLARTKVKGAGLASFKSHPRWNILYLDGTPLTEDGLKALSGATCLQYLSLNQVPLNETALPLLRALPGVNQLELTGCGFLDEEIADLLKSKPGLKIMRR